MRASRRAPTHAVGAKLVRFGRLFALEVIRPLRQIRCQPVMICAPRNAAAGIRRGSGAESRERDVRTAQMITTSNRQTRSLCLLAFVDCSHVAARLRDCNRRDSHVVLAPDAAETVAISTTGNSHSCSVRTIRGRRPHTTLTGRPQHRDTCDSGEFRRVCRELAALRVECRYPVRRSSCPPAVA